MEVKVNNTIAANADNIPIDNFIFAFIDLYLFVTRQMYSAMKPHEMDKID